MAKTENSKKITAGAVACAIALLTVVISVIGLAIHNKPEAQAVSLGVGQVDTYDKKFKSFSKSSDENVVTVEDGVVTAVGTGTCTVSVGLSDYNITVYDAPEKVEFAQKEFLLGVGEEVLNPAIGPEADFIPNGLYKSSDESVATIDELGKITAVGAGEAVITAATYNNLKDECKITVKKAPEKIWFESDCKELAVGKTQNLNPTVGDDFASSVITVVSSDESILEAWDSGKIKAVKEGKVIVTATSFNGKTAEREITVVAPPSPGPGDFADCVRKDLDPNKPMVAFTFDDGPNASTTNRILNVLEEYNGSATFFIVGNRATGGANKEAVKRMVSMGCQLGNHTYDHEHYGKNVTAGDISKCSEAIKNATGYYPSAFRPTGGELSSTIKKSANLPIYIWSLDTLDWKTRNADSTYNKILNNVDDGDIVLMHDIYKPTASAVEMVVPELVKRGYQIVNIAELEYYKGVKAQNGEVYYSF